jgi:hypothetical protein
MKCVSIVQRITKRGGDSPGRTVVRDMAAVIDAEKQIVALPKTQRNNGKATMTTTREVLNYHTYYYAGFLATSVSRKCSQR